MAKFRVKVGTHHDGKKSYSKGELVESHSDLEQVFRNKFERVHEAPPPEPVAKEKSWGDEEETETEKAPQVQQFPAPRAKPAASKKGG